MIRKSTMFGLALLFALTLVGCGNDSDCGNLEVGKDGECIEVTDTTAPTITGIHNINYTTEDDAPDYLDGLSATDDTDGDLTASIAIDTSAVDLTTAGEYTVTVSVTDAAGNETTETFTITVTEAIPDYEALTATDFLLLDVPASIEPSNAMSELDLKKYGQNGTRFSWETSDPNVITDSGFVRHPFLGEEAVVVTLTVTANNGPYLEEKTYTVTVEPHQEVTVTGSDSIPFTNLTDQYSPVNRLDVEIFFVDDGAVPYMDVAEYIEMLDGVLDSDALQLTPIDADKLQISYQPVLTNYYLFYTEKISVAETYQALGTMTPVVSEGEDFTAMFDFTANTITFSSYLFFAKLSTMDNPEESEGIDVVDVDVEYGDPFTIPLNDYNIDILIHNDGTKDNFLAPYHLLETMFTTTVFFSTFYKPEGFYGEELSWDVDSRPIITSDMNGEPIPFDIKLASYNLLMLSLDYFSMMKDFLDVDSFAEYLKEEEEPILNAPDSYYYSRLGNLIRDLDDFHAVPSSQGYYTSDPTDGISITTAYGPRWQQYFDNYGAYMTRLSSKYGNFNISSSRPDVRYLDDDKTAIMYFYTFNRGMSDLFHDRLEALPANIENVVLDVTFNNGGNVGAVFRVFGYMTDENVWLHMVNERNNNRLSYLIANTHQTYDYNWYIQTSDMSNGAASAIAAAAQENDIATVIGERTYGATSIYDLLSLPCGFIYTLPSYNTFYGRSGNEVDGYTYFIIEDGVDPDYEIDDILDDQQIINAINQHQTDTAD